MDVGRYEIVGELGRGGMGIVWQAYDPALDRQVALKELSLDTESSEAVRARYVERFFTEARAAARLSHPNIVTIHDVGEDQGRVYLSMEILEGPTVGEALHERGRLSVGETQDVMLQVAEALGAAHRRGVVHRDIKPDNCFWLPDGRVKVADFGIARVTSESSKTQTGTVMGTPGYMAPEQVRGQSVTAAADIFSWGTMAYECLAGQPPFGRDDAAAVMYRIVHEDPPDLSEACPEAPPGLVAVIARALAKDPADRYADADELLADLAPLTTETQTRKSSIPPWAQTPATTSQGKIRPSRIAAIMGAIALALVVITIAVVIATQPSAESSDTSSLPDSVDEAADAMVDAWRANDQAGAEAVASTRAVQTLFGVSPGESVSKTGCYPQGSHYVCHYTPYQDGVTGTAVHLLVRYRGIEGGYQVAEVVSGYWSP